MTAHHRGLARFADRLGCLVLDGIILYGWYLVVALVISVVVALATVLAGDSPGTGYGLFVLAVYAVSLVVQVIIWWKVVPGRMASLGGSVGMSLGRLEIEEAGRTSSGISGLRALGRAVIAGLLSFVLVAVVVGVGIGLAAFAGRSVANDLSDGSTVGSSPIWFVVTIPIASVAAFVPALWALVDRRNQTLYDKMSGTVVVGPAGPTARWCALSLTCGLATPLAGPFTAIPAIVLGHLGVRNVEAARGARAGRGAARAGLVLGYVALVLWSVLAVLVMIGVIAGGQAVDESATSTPDSSSFSGSTTFDESFMPEQFTDETTRSSPTSVVVGGDQLSDVHAEAACGLISAYSQTTSSPIESYNQVVAANNEAQLSADEAIRSAFAEFAGLLTSVKDGQVSVAEARANLQPVTSSLVTACLPYLRG